MASLLVKSKVKDFAHWKKVFDANQDFRKHHGELSASIYCDASDPNLITLLFGWDSLANAQKFVHSPELKANMEKAGVEGAPQIHFLKKAGGEFLNAGYQND